MQGFSGFQPVGFGLGDGLLCRAFSGKGFFQAVFVGGVVKCGISEGGFVFRQGFFSDRDGFFGGFERLFERAQATAALGIKAFLFLAVGSAVGIRGVFSGGAVLFAEVAVIVVKIAVERLQFAVSDEADGSLLWLDGWR